MTSWLGFPFAPCLRDFEVRFREASDFIRADANFEQHIDISDPITVLRTLFFGDARIRCSDGADANDDGAVDISDAIYGLYYLFRARPPPFAPFPEAGSDPTPDGLHCIEHV